MRCRTTEMPSRATRRLNDARRGVNLERGAESGIALEGGDPEGMFGLSGTMTRERIPTHSVVGSRPRNASYCDHSCAFPHQNSSAGLSSVGEFPGHSLSAPHPLTYTAVFKHLYCTNAMFYPGSKDASARAGGLKSSPTISSEERPTTSFNKGRYPVSLRAATYLQSALSKSLDPVGMSMRGIWVQNVWVDWQNAAQLLHYRMGVGWDDLDSARSCGAERGPDGVKAKSDRISWSPGQAMGKEETAQ